MAWFKVDDKLHSHKKAARAGAHAMGLWTVAGSWCADQLTDGFVPDYIAERMAPGESDKLAVALVGARLWEEGNDGDDKGWWFRNWAEYQPTREDVEAKREYERDKKRNRRRSPSGQFTPSPEVSPGDTDGDSPGESSHTRPVPSRPVPKEDTSSAKADSDAGFERFWLAYPKRNGLKVGKKEAKAQWAKLSLADRDDALDAVVNYCRTCDVGTVLAKDAHRWLRGRLWDEWAEAVVPSVARSQNGGNKW